MHFMILFRTTYFWGLSVIVSHIDAMSCLCSSSFTVPLKTLKPFDCEDYNELVVSIAHKLCTQKNYVFLSQ